MKTSIPCNVVILPEPDLASMAIRASKKLESLGSLFALESGKYYPHASLYMLQLRTETLPKAEQLLADIAASTESVAPHPVRYYQAEGYIDVEYQKTHQLAQLQDKVVSALNPIRDGMREKDKARMLEATGAVRQNLEQYGYRGVGELFRPHLTLTRFADEQPDIESKLPASFRQFGGQFTKLGLFEMGDNGTCIRQIADFDLITKEPARYLITLRSGEQRITGKFDYPEAVERWLNTGLASLTYTHGNVRISPHDVVSVQPIDEKAK